MTNHFDLAVLGGGIGGYTAAIRASQLGMKVAIIESEKLGGTCLHKGCIPSKALLKSANLFRKTKELNDFGIEVENITFNFQKAMKRKESIINKLYKGVQYLVKKNKVTLFKGFGRILGPSIFSPIAGTISIEHDEGENTMIVPKFVLIATGSSPKLLPNLSLSENIITSEAALEMEKLPKSISIVGAGVIGIEWASMLTDLGVNVTVLELGDCILPNMDQSIQQYVQKQLEKRGVTFYLNTNLLTSTLEEGENKVCFTIKQNKEEKNLQSEKILIAIGREANTKEIGLENTSIVKENSFIQTNEHFQTKESHIYAIGDCIGNLQLAHVAQEEGIKAVEHMNEVENTSIDYEYIPSCVYSEPEVASIGLTEEDASQKYEIKTAKINFSTNGKSLTDGDTNGFVKLIQDKKTDDLLGVHMVGKEVTNQISELSLAKTLDASVWELTQVIRPHPSRTEILTEVSLAIENLQINS